MGLPRTIRHLLDFARPHSHPTALQVNEVIRNLIKFVEPDLLAHNIRTVLELAPGLPVIQMSPRSPHTGAPQPGQKRPGCHACRRDPLHQDGAMAGGSNQSAPIFAAPNWLTVPPMPCSISQGVWGFVFRFVRTFPGREPGTRQAYIGDSPAYAASSQKPG